MKAANRLSTRDRLILGHGIGAAGFIVLGQVAVALPPGPADAKGVLAALTIPVLAAGGSLLLIAAAEGRREQQAEVPTPRRQVAAPQRKELAR